MHGNSPTLRHPCFFVCVCVCDTGILRPHCPTWDSAPLSHPSTFPAVFYKLQFCAPLLITLAGSRLIEALSSHVLDSCLHTSYLTKSGHYSIHRIAAIILLRFLVNFAGVHNDLVTIWIPGIRWNCGPLLHHLTSVLYCFLGIIITWITLTFLVQ